MEWQLSENLSTFTFSKYNMDLISVQGAAVHIITLEDKWKDDCIGTYGTTPTIIKGLNFLTVLLWLKSEQSSSIKITSSGKLWLAKILATSTVPK